jgi:hypothetical protein
LKAQKAAFHKVFNPIGRFLLSHRELRQSGAFARKHVFDENSSRYKEKPSKW